VAKCNKCGGLLGDTDICSPCRVAELAAHLASLQTVRALLRVERDLSEWQRQRIDKLEAEVALFLEHGLAATEREDKLRAALQASRRLEETVDVMRRNGFVIDNLDDRWQKFAFTLYNIILRIDDEAGRVLDKTDPTLLHEVPEGLMKSICADLVKFPEADRTLSRQLAANQREVSAVLGIPHHMLEPMPPYSEPSEGEQRSSQESTDLIEQIPLGCTIARSTTGMWEVWCWGNNPDEDAPGVGETLKEALEKALEKAE